MFGKKPSCAKCKSKISDSFDFCPYCGLNLMNPERDQRDFGMLGKNEMVGQPIVGGLGGLGITDKMINSLMKNLMKAFDSQMKGGSANIHGVPGGRIRIKFGTEDEPQKKVESKPKSRGRMGITKDQIKRMSGLPRVEGKADVRRFSDSVVYEIRMPDLEAVEDVFLSKLESGYEVKAIGKKKVYVNSLPVNLPLRSYVLDGGKLVVEFGLA